MGKGEDQFPADIFFATSLQKMKTALICFAMETAQ